MGAQGFQDFTPYFIKGHPNPGGNFRYFISSLHSVWLVSILWVMFLWDGWKRSFSSYWDDIIVHLDFVWILQHVDAEILAGTTRSYSHGRLSSALVFYLDMNLRSACNFDVRFDVICGFHRTVRRWCV